jgi:hypothetical protein
MGFFREDGFATFTEGGNHEKIDLPQLRGRIR